MSGWIGIALNKPVSSVVRRRPLFKEQTTMNENWKDIPGYEGRYQVSDLGRVKSLDRVEGMPTRWGSPTFRQRKGQLLKLVTDKDGYLRVGLYAAPAPMKFASVHRLVALAFVPNPHGHRDVDHIDSNRANAGVTNLQWVGEGENIRLMVERGRSVRGDAHPKAALNARTVLSIRERIAAGARFTDVAKEYGVSDVAVRNAALSRTWRHV